MTQRSQRVFVEGRGSTVLAPVQLGDTTIPLGSVDMFEAVAGVFLKVSFQGSEGGAQHLTFTGVEPGGGGTLVGPGISPAGAPAAAAQVGTGLTAGVYNYVYTDTTASGESLPSPLASVTVGSVAAPTPTPQPFLRAGTTGPELGAHTYAYSFVTATGETTPSPLSASVTPDLATVTAVVSPNYAEIYIGGSMNDNNWFTYVTTFTGINGGETTYNGSHQVYLTDGNRTIRVYHSSTVMLEGWAAIKLYRSAAGGAAPYKYVGTYAGSYFDDTLADASLGATVPSSNTATYYRRNVLVQNLAVGGVSVTGRNLYRTAVGSAQLKLVASLNNVVTSYTDAIADASLGANAPTTNTAGGDLLQVGLTGIAIGPSGTTARKVYRTVANGAQLKLQSTIANNTATTATDNVADGSLGANVPTGDTSGFVQPDGQVVAGSSSILIAGAGAFLPGGGWANIGNGDSLMRYTGITGNTLTGIPTSGVGAIAATVAYNSTITAAPMVTGIPASGTGSILRALSAGDEVYLVVQRDNTTAQAILAARLDGDGIREDSIQDRRLSIPEATARGDAFLASRPLDAASVSYTCRDLNTTSGKTITVDLVAPTNVSGTFRIQRVVWSNFRPYANQYPTATVTAAAQLYSFEDLLRQRKRDG